MRGSSFHNASSRWRDRPTGRFALLSCGLALLAACVFLPRWPQAETAWVLARLGLLALSFAISLPALVKRREKPAAEPSGFPFSRRMPAFLAILLAFEALLSGHANQWSADTVRSNWADVISYFLQARIFASGHLAAPSPGPREFFAVPYVLDRDRVFSKYPPGWPAILALGVLARMPWIVNPTLTVLALAALFRLGRRIYDERTAAMAVGFAAVSLHVVYHATSYFSEPASLLLATLGVLHTLELLRSGSVAAGVLAGACWGGLFLVRPCTAVALAVPVAAWSLPFLRKRPLWKPLLAAFIPCSALVALHLYYNHVATGSAFTFPFTLYNPHDKMGFGTRSFDPDLPLTLYGPQQAFRQLIRSAVMANVYFIPFGFVLAGIALARHPRSEDRLLFLCLLGVIALHFFYFAQQERYWFPSFFAIALLAARGIQRLAASIESRVPGYPARPTGATLFAMLAFVSFSLTANHVMGEEFPLRRRLADLRERVAEARLTHAVVFLASAPVPNVGHYVQVAPPDAPVLYVRDLGDRNIAFLRRHPGRAAYRYEYDSTCGKGRLCPILPERIPASGESLHPPGSS